jgi:replication factor A1
MGHQLTPGAVAIISEGGGDGMQPVLQISDVRLVSTAQNTTERYRMLLSDGTHSQQAMLATQLNTLVKSGDLQTGSIVKLNEYICNHIQGRRYDLLFRSI